MKRKIKSDSSIFSFLNSSGVLENGTHEEIQKVRKEYWREYKRKWRNDKRKAETEFTLSFNKQELKELSLEAKRHKLSRTKFIKQACFAYINKSFITPDILEVRRISQLLSMTYNSIREVLEENKISFRDGKSSLELIHKLEREILPVLYHPTILEESLRKHILKSKSNKAHLLELIDSF